MSVSTLNNTTTQAASQATSSTSSKSGAKALSDTYQTFLSLLTSQIRNQDPLSPMDTTQWTNQLVQYNGVEQQLKTNSLLESLVSQSKGDVSSGVNYIGKTVTANTDSASLSGGKASWNYDLGANAASVTLSIKDSKGNIVYTKAGETGAGAHSFTWDGTQASGPKLTSGDYSLSIQAKDANNAAIATSTYQSGKVTAVLNNNGDISLKVGQNSIPINKIISVEQSTT